MSDKRKKTIVIIILTISALPWVFALGFGIYCAFAGFTWLFNTFYGFEGFFNGFLIVAFGWWFITLPTAIAFILCISYLLYQKFFKTK